MMSSCEKCWQESRFVDSYHELLESRKDSPCTPEEQAGPNASECPKCKRMTLHQHTRECMNGCRIGENERSDRQAGKEGVKHG